MTQTKACPDYQDLAAFAEGSREGEARHAVLLHLDQCDHCREIVEETHLFLGDATSQSRESPGGSNLDRVVGRHQDPEHGVESRADAGLSVAPPPAKRMVPWAFGSLAAAALLAVSFGIFKLIPTGMKHEKLLASSSPSTSEHQGRAQTVFQRLIAVIDKPTEQAPELLVRRLAGSPYACALQGDMVLLSERGLNFCYEGVAPEIGDTRLAFVLAHELVHLSHGEYGHAFMALRGGGKPLELIRRFHQRDAEADSKEKRADANALVFAAMGNFQPKILVDGDRSFFEQWSEELPTTAAYGSYSESSRRTHALLEDMRAVADDIRIFEEGLAHYRAGRFQQARGSWNLFAKRFPSREVSNNLGLTWHQEAAAILANCDGKLIMRFRLPLQLDEATLAGKAVLRGSGDDDSCFEAEGFKAALAKARAYFQEASRKDPSYMKARINDLCGYLLEGDENGALNLIQQMREKGKDHRSLSHLEALSKLLAYRKLGDRGQTAAADMLAKLETFAQRNPEDSNLAYNLGALHWSAGNMQKARFYWLMFLDQVDGGEHATYVRKRLGIE